MLPILSMIDCCEVRAVTGRANLPDESDSVMVPFIGIVNFTNADSDSAFILNPTDQLVFGHNAVAFESHLGV